MDIVDINKPLLAVPSRESAHSNVSNKKHNVQNYGQMEEALLQPQQATDQPIQNQSKGYTVSAEIALRLCGNAHKYQLKVMLIMSLICLIGAFINMGFPYFFSDKDVWCTQLQTDQISTENKPFLCTQHEACQPGIRYTYGKDNLTLTARFDLLCEEDSYEGFCGALLLLGGCIGSAFYADTTETGGRLRVIRETAWIMTISSIVACFSINMIMFGICMIFYGIGYRAFFNACIIYLTETTSENMRQLAPNILSIGWAIGQIVLALLAMINEDWQLITLIYTALPLIICLTFTRFMVESPRYLVARKRFADAHKALLHISYINSRPLPEDFKLQEEIQQTNFNLNLDKILGITKPDQSESNLFTTNNQNNRNQGKKSQQNWSQSNDMITMSSQSKAKSHSYKSLFEFKSLRVRTIVITYLWCVLSFSYFVSAFAIEHFSGNIHYNLMGMGLGELIAYFYSGYLSLHYPRVKIVRGIMWIAGLIHLAFFAFLNQDKSSIVVNVMSFSSIIALRLAISSGNCIFNVYIAEVYPTTVRHYAFGYFGLTTKLIAILAPPFVQLCEVANISPFIPLSIFFFAGIPTLSKLRETFGHPLQDNLEEEDNALLQTDLIPLLPFIKHKEQHL